MDNPLEGIVFDTITSTGIQVVLDRRRWEVVCGKHADMHGRDQDVREALENPEEVRFSNHHPHVVLFYRRVRSPLYTCMVVHYEPGREAFINTCYRTRLVKAGRSAR